MPISRYDIVCATHPSDLNGMMAEGGYIAIGHIFAEPSYGLQAVGVGSIDPWGSVTDYELIQAQFYKDLIPQVNDKIAEGYQPIGGIAHWANAFVQAVGKVDASGSGGGSSGGSSIPKGTIHEVLGYDADGTPTPGHVRVDQWTGADDTIGGNVGAWLAGAEIAPGTKLSAGKTRIYGLSNGTQAISVALRDNGGRLSGKTASADDHLVPLKQVREMIDDAQGGSVVINPLGAPFQVMGFDAGGGSAQPIQMSMDVWMGAKTTQDGPTECVPTTMFNTGGLLSVPAMRPLDALATPGTVAFRDANGRLSVNDAVAEKDVVNLKQMQDIITARLKEFQDNIIDFINNGGAK